MQLQQKDIVLTGAHGKPIVLDISYLPTTEKQPVVIFCHGYKGFKDWGAWNLVAAEFAAAGICFVKFNFSHNGGTVADPIDFPDLEAFGNNNYIKELEDVATVLDWVMELEHTQGISIDDTRLTIIGHSRGGGIATIKAAEDSRITKLITWAGVSDYASRFPTGSTLEQWKETNVFYVENGRTKQQMPHYYQFYTSFKANEERLTIATAAQRLQIPHLIIHGMADPTVAVQEAEQLHQWNADSELYLVDQADHVFGAKHPWEYEFLPDDLATVVQKSVAFTII